MALEKTIDYKGFDVTYWKITQVEIDAIANKTKIFVGGYKDRDTRLLSIKNYLGIVEFEFPEIIVSVSEFYTALKTTDLLIGATDVLE